MSGARQALSAALIFVGAAVLAGGAWLLVDAAHQRADAERYSRPVIAPASQPAAAPEPSFPTAPFQKDSSAGTADAPPIRPSDSPPSLSREPQSSRDLLSVGASPRAVEVDLSIQWVRVPAIGVQSAVIMTEWDPPSFLVGHLARTAGLGQEGLSVLVGHVAGIYGDVF